MIALALAACDGGVGGGGGGGGSATAIDCTWLTGTNCWKESAAAATACTNSAATGLFNPATTLCTYADGATVQFDPAYPATVSFHQSDLWDFTIVSSTAATCARYVEPTDSSFSLTTSLGTFSADWTNDPILFTCPDGSRYSLPGETALTCVSAFPGWLTSWSGSTLAFRFFGAPADDDTVWRCR